MFTEERMTRPRKELISLADTPYYHCVSRCVRRAFLCGSGDGYSFEHRRGWIVQRIKQLATVFTIDIAAYAVMANHYHLVLRVDAALCQALSSDEVIDRWRTLFAGPPLVQRYAAGHHLLPAERVVVDEIVATWRQRLGDISWFMRCLNEPIARLANQEDNCSGRFWEGRFKSQALLDERALLSCMAYVDLNPIRAGIADRPETSDYTSLQERLGLAPADQAKTARAPDATVGDQNIPTPLAGLLPFSGSDHGMTQPRHIPFDLLDYLQLVDWTGRAVRDDKRDAIAADLPAILQRLNLRPRDWLPNCCELEQRFGRAIGPVAKITVLCERVGQRWIHGIRHCRRFYSPQST